MSEILRVCGSLVAAGLGMFTVPGYAAANSEDTAVVTDVTAGKCEKHPMLLEQKTTPLSKGMGLDATDYVRCRNGGHAALKYAETGGVFTVESGKWHVVGNAGAPLKEDLSQPRRGRTAKKEKPLDVNGLPS